MGASATTTIVNLSMASQKVPTARAIRAVLCRVALEVGPGVMQTMNQSDLPTIHSRRAPTTSTVSVEVHRCAPQNASPKTKKMMWMLC